MKQSETLKLISHLSAIITKNKLVTQIDKQIITEFFNTTNEVDRELLRLFDMENAQ